VTHSSNGPNDPTRVSGGVEVRTIGPYRLLQRVGEGGMGEVWLAEQTAPLRRRVALKVIKAGMDSRQVIARFEVDRYDEANALYLKALNGQRRVLGDGHPETQLTVDKLEKMYDSQHRDREAEALLLTTYDRLDDRQSDAKERLARALESFYDRRGEAGKAAVWRAKAGAGVPR
jgi:serine/threonine protein kinase